MTTTRNRLCIDCQKPTSGARCVQHAAAARIGVPRGVATPGPRKRPKERSTRSLYPLPIPSDDTRPLTIEEGRKALCVPQLRVQKDDVCFPEDASSVRAKILCHGCPVQARCLAIGIANREPIGIWGGATVAERETIRRKMVRTSA